MPGPGRPFATGNKLGKGRPKKDRALTDLLEAAGSRKVDTPDGPSPLKKIAVAKVWEGLTEGVVQFPGRELYIGSRDYVELVKFLFTHVDGPPKAEAEVEHKGGLTIHVTYDDPDTIAPEAASGATDGDA